MSTINGNTTINGTLTVSNKVTAEKDLHVRGWLYAANVADIYKGSFANTTELNARWPAASCEDGWVAGVGNQTNGLIAYVFNATAGEWQSTEAKLYIDTNTDIAELQSGKVDKVGSATAGKIALLKSDGGITQQNSKSLSELANASHTHGRIASDGTIDTSQAKAIQGGDKMIVLQDGKTIVGRKVVFDGTTREKALTQAGTFEKFMTSHQDISGKADKVSSPTNGNLVTMNSGGNLTNSGKKASDFENVSNKVTDFEAANIANDTKYPSARLTYYSILEFMGLSVNEAVRVTFHPDDDGEQYVLSDDVMEYVKLIVKDGTNYTTNKIELTGNEDNIVSFVFKDPSTILDKAFQNIANITKVHIPSFVHSIGSNAFNTADDGLVDIECEAMTPPTIGNNVFNFPGGDPNNVTLHVHNCAKGDYGNDPNWNVFNIVTTF